MLLDFVKKSLLKKWIDAFYAAQEPSALEQVTAEKDEQQLRIQQALNDQPYLNQLKTVIAVGDWQNKIFNEEHCLLWLTFLYHSKQLNLDDFLQTYISILAAGEYPNTLVIANSSDANAEPLLKQYVAQLATSYHLSSDDLITTYQNLTGFNRLLILIPLDSGVLTNDRLLNAVLYADKEDGTMLRVVANRSRDFLVIPSVSFLKSFVRKINPTHEIIDEPIFGSINNDTLFHTFHHNRKRPISLYSPWVLSNLTSAHNLQASPLSIAVHDFHFHYMKLGFIPEGQFSSMVDIIYPEVLALFEHEPKSARSGYKYTKGKIEQLGDFNPTFSVRMSSDACDLWLLALSPYTPLRQQKDNGLLSTPSNYYLFIVNLSRQLLTKKNEAIIQLAGLNMETLVNTLLFASTYKTNNFIQNCLTIPEIVGRLSQLDAH
ncbi:MAG: hypothetical protein WAW86_09035 [Gammaproteobacteria bacterium]